MEHRAETSNRTLVKRLLEGIQQQEALVRRLLEKGDVAQALEIAGLLLRKRELLRIALAENDHPGPISRHAELCINA